MRFEEHNFGYLDTLNAFGSPRSTAREEVRWGENVKKTFDYYYYYYWFGYIRHHLRVSKLKPSVWSGGVLSIGFPLFPPTPGVLAFPIEFVLIVPCCCCCCCCSGLCGVWPRAVTPAPLAVAAAAACWARTLTTARSSCLTKSELALPPPPPAPPLPAAKRFTR